MGHNFNMATSMKNVRVKLDLHEICGSFQSAACISWYLVDTKTLTNISDLQEDVLAKYLSKSTETRDNLQLTVDGCLIPKWASVTILRENDTLRFSFAKPNVSISEEKPRKRKKKKEKKKHDKDINVRKHKKSQAKKRKRDQSSDEELESIHQKRGKSERKNLVSHVKEDVGTSKADLKMGHAAINKPGRAITSPVSGTAREKSNTSFDKNKIILSKQTKEVSSSSSSSSASSDTDRQVVGRSAVKSNVIVKRTDAKAENIGILKKDNKVDKESSDSSTSESDTEVGSMTNIGTMAVSRSLTSGEQVKQDEEKGLASGNVGNKRVGTNREERTETSSSDSDSDSSIAERSAVTGKPDNNSIVVKSGDGQGTSLDLANTIGGQYFAIDDKGTSVTSYQGNAGDDDTKGIIPGAEVEVVEETKVEDVKQQSSKRRRRRPRSRKKKGANKDNIGLTGSAEKYLTAPMAVGSKNVSFTLVDVNDKDIVSVSPISSGRNNGQKEVCENYHGKQAWHQQKRTTEMKFGLRYKRDNKNDGNQKHIKFGSDEEGDIEIQDGSNAEVNENVEHGRTSSMYDNAGKVKQGISAVCIKEEVPSVSVDDCSMSVDSPDHSSITRGDFQGNSQNTVGKVITSTPMQNNWKTGGPYKNNVKCSGETGTVCESDVIKSKCELLSGAQVFMRTRHKKRGNFPLSKAQALSDQQTNKSFKFENNEGGKLVKKQKNADNAGQEKEGVDIAAKFEPTPPVRDYDSMPKLYGPPRVGDRVAYKVLEMTDNYSPEVSAFKEATVTSFDPQSQMVELRLTATNETKKHGRFDVVVEDEESILTNKPDQAIVQLNLHSMMDTRLVTVDDKK